MAPKPLLRIRSTAKKTFGETFGAATGVSDPGYKRSEYETTAQVSLLPDEGKWNDDVYDSMP